MPGKKIEIRVGTKEWEQANHLKVNGALDPLGPAYLEYDELHNPTNKLSKDINRVKHVYLLDEEDEYVDKKKNRSTGDLVLSQLTQDPAKQNKLEGLNQFTAGALLMLMNSNFNLRVNTDNPFPILVPKGREIQSLVQIGENEFRFDYQNIVYTIEQDGVSYYRNKEGRLIECKDDDLKYALTTWYQSQPNIQIEVTSDGVAKIPITRKNGTVEYVECLPFANLQGSVTMHLDRAQNDVDINYSMETLTSELDYRGNKVASPGLVLAQDVELVPKTVIPFFKQFPGLNDKANQDSVAVLRAIAANHINKQSDRVPSDRLSTNFEQFLKASSEALAKPNLNPIEEIKLYQNFFKSWKASVSPTSGSPSEYQARMLIHIAEWERILMSCSHEMRSYLAQKMKDNVDALQPKTLRERLAEVFSPPYAFKLDLPSLEQEFNLQQRMERFKRREGVYERPKDLPKDLKVNEQVNYTPLKTATSKPLSSAFSSGKPSPEVASQKSAGIKPLSQNTEPNEADEALESDKPSKNEP